MTDRKFEITDARGGAALGIRVVTRAAETEIAGKGDDGTLRVRLKASHAGDPDANQELVEFLATKLEIATTKIEIVVGAGNRDKILSFEGLSVQEIETKLQLRG
jgi:uncharacterized protein YggU (UPF0235/DUF167 family)